MARAKRMNIPTEGEFLEWVEERLVKKSIPESTFGRKFGDPCLMREMRAGRNVTLRMARRIAEALA